MPEFTVDVEFEVYCSCGAGLCQLTETEDSRSNGRGRRAIIEPCPRCMEAAEDKGYGRGYQEAEAALEGGEG